MTTQEDFATAYVLRQLRELEAVTAPVSGLSSGGLILPPADEDPHTAGRIAMYKRWLARAALPLSEREKWQEYAIELRLHRNP